MGNLFLDHDMNLKIGDFGLAAVLVSPEEYKKGLYENAKKRRTTLCGTPNYIAPEILEKGKGHDYKVDVWAIGVILFAMISGQPPFQSASQNEIYRRARALEYDWPQKDRHLNDIPEEAKDLVAQLLKVDAEERPDPDQVVGHPFFSMHGGDALPLLMDESMTRQIPSFLDVKARPRGDVMRKGAERLHLKALARECGVGQFLGERDPLPAVGEDIDISLFGQCYEEEKSGNAPIVPMPKDMVYISKFLSASLQIQMSSQPPSTDPDLEQHEALPVRTPTDKAVQYLMPERPRRAPVQSHAATLRAAHAAGRTAQSTARPEREAISGTNIRSQRTQSTDSASVRSRRGLLNELPVRPVVNASNTAGLEAKTLARNPRATRLKQIHVLDDDQPQVPSSKSEVVHDLLSRDQRIAKAQGESDSERRDMSVRTRARIASNVQKEMLEPAQQPRRDSLEITAARAHKVPGSPKPGNALIGPDEVSECLPRTKPDDILRQLKRLHKELETCLEDISKGRGCADIEDLHIKNKGLKYRPVVVKWVDYTNKFGIGYILANGTVGCVFKSDETSLPSCVVVAGAENHLKNRKVSAYAEKHQIVPCTGASIQFIENCHEDGLKRVLVRPSTYQLAVNDDVPERLGPGLDVHDYEKRKKLCLWDKFGKYMTQTLGKDEGEAQTLFEEPASGKHRRNNVAGPFVKFYQRLGNVGIWGFGDGSFQFNFPDHTKLVISSSGDWLDFYHLPIPAAQALKCGASLEAGALAERSVLSYPATVMLCGTYKDHDFKKLVEENELTAKMAFASLVVGVWSKEGGLGCMGCKKGVKWDGMMEKGGKLVWVTVGAKGGDERYETPVANA
ncbi:hypothetical protein P7C71_g3658, partial [Lecanoromycetidae sp. Uapishka_2]